LATKSIYATAFIAGTAARPRDEVVQDRGADARPARTCAVTSEAGPVATPRVDLDPRVHRAGVQHELSGRSRSGVIPSARCTRAGRHVGRAGQHPLALHRST
jgi:hypothetical protein